MPWKEMQAQWNWPTGFAESRLDSWLYGYGFSYVFYRHASVEHPFLDMNIGEDYKFLCKLRNISKNLVKLVYDNTGIVLHTLHPKASSTCYVAREVPKRELLTMEIAPLASLLNTYF